MVQLGQWLPIISRATMKVIFGDTPDADAHWNVVQNNGMFNTNHAKKKKKKPSAFNKHTLCVIYRSQSSTSSSPCPFSYCPQTATGPSGSVELYHVWPRPEGGD